MLKGLEISEKKLLEVSLDNETFRLDSEYFGRTYLKTIKMLHSLKNEKLLSITSWITQGPNPIFTEGEKIPCLTGRNVSDGRVSYEQADFISQQEYEELKRFQLKQGDILVTLKGKGSIGKIGFVTSKQKAIFSRNLGIIRPKNINASYLNAYLLSKYGQTMILRGETGGTGQSTLTCSYLKNLDIPRLNIEESIGELIIKSENILIQSQAVYCEGKSLLLKELGLSDWKFTEQVVSVKNFADIVSNGRFDAEYYQPRYDKLLNHIKQYQYDTLGNLGVFVNGSLISDDYYTFKAKRAYIRIKELSLDHPINDDAVIYIDDAFNQKNETTVQTNDYVIATIGNTIGKINLITKQYNGSFISNNTSRYRLNDANANFYYYELLLRSIVVQEQIEREYTQTAQPKITNVSLENIIVPILPASIQQQIASKIQDSFALRAESKRLLDLAKMVVEIAIEQGEQEAMKLLN